MYGYEIEIDDNASWKEKMNVLTVLLPLFSQPVQETGFMNKDEVVKVIVDELYKEIKKTTSMIDLEDNFTFFIDDLFYTTMFDKETFKNIIELIDEKDSLKAIVESVLFYFLKMNTEESFNTSKYLEYVSKKFNGSADAPICNDDLIIINYLSSTDKIEKCGFKGGILMLLNCCPEFKYHTDIDEDTIELLVDNGMLSITSLTNSFDNEVLTSTSMESLEKNLSKFTKFLEYYIDNKVTTIDLRKKFIKILEDYKNNENELIKLMIETINDVLLESTPNRDAIKADWIEASLNKDSGNLSGSESFDW